MKNKWNKLLLLSFLFLPIPIFLYSCASNYLNNQSQLIETKTPSSIKENGLQVHLSDNNQEINTTIVAKNLNLQITLDEKYANNNLKIIFTNNASDLFLLDESNFTNSSQYKILDGTNYTISSKNKAVVLMDNSKNTKVNFELYEDNKVVQTFSVNVNFNFVKNNLNEFIKFKDGGEISNGIIANQYALLLKDLNILNKDMDVTLLTDQNIKNKIDLVTNDDGNKKYSDINLSLKENSSSYNDDLYLDISGSYLGYQIEPSVIKISNLHSYQFPKENIYKLSSNIKLNDQFIIDLKNKDDILNISENEIVKYLKPFNVTSQDDQFTSLNINPSKFKSMKIEFDNNSTIKKISGSFDISNYQNKKWTSQTVTKTFVNKSIFYFEDFLIQYFDNTEILKIISNNFVEIDNQQIKNVFPSKLNFDFGLNQTGLPLYIQKDKIDVLASKYFNNNNIFIFKYLESSGITDDINGSLEFSYEITNENYRDTYATNNVKINNLQKFGDVYNGASLGIEGNSSLIKEKFSTTLENEIKKDSELVNKINKLEINNSLDITSFNNNFILYIKNTKNISPYNIKTLSNNLNLMILSKNINETNWDQSSYMFDNLFILKWIEINTDKIKQYILREENGLKYVLQTQYKLIISNREIILDCEFFTKLQLSSFKQ